VTAAGPRPVRLVLVHGFTQTGRSWQPVVEQLARGAGAGRAPVSIEAPDLPGHGAAGDVRTSFAATAAALVDRVAGPSVYVGYSLGGRIVLRLACDHPDAVAGLVTIGATGGLDDPAERAARVAADEQLAARIERHGVDAFLERWLRQPLFATLPATAARLDERRANTAAGLAASLRLLGTGTMEPLWDRLAALGARRAPARFVAGALDTRFAAAAERLAAAVGPPARALRVEGAGHAAHLERPEAVAAVIAEVVGEAAAGPAL
jgi:2-succinyl-6-hydroxy-2,4-cyclohexadiene-1-carboxylate synthase